MEKLHQNDQELIDLYLQGKLSINQKDIFRLRLKDLEFKDLLAQTKHMKKIISLSEMTEKLDMLKGLEKNIGRSERKGDD